MLQKQFSEVIQLIHQARNNAIKAVNTELINLYWNIGEYISKQVKGAEWGQSVVQQLADYLQKTDPGLKGFSNKNLWRMKQFYETYANQPKLSPLVREISWTHNLIILSRTNTPEEQEFYLRLCILEKYSKRELDRQINSGAFERTMLSNQKISSLVKEVHPAITDHFFKDHYIFEFLNLPDQHTETDLQKNLIMKMKDFVLELGKDFVFYGQEYRLQVGNNDFYIDLLFYHRSLQCLVAIELKAERFNPSHLGQLNFYLEALDRDVKKPNENPSIGILLCKDKDSEVVKYALSRSLSPTLIAEYKMQLPDKNILQQKLHTLFEESPDLDLL